MEEFRDSLTGVYSRGALQDRLQDEVARASRYETIFSLIILDVDYFKTVNDAFGHRRGDEVLVEVVRRIGEAIRESDLLFRYGGDEFVIFLPHTAKPEAAVIAGRVLNHIRATAFSGKPPLNLAASLGIASFPDEGSTPEALFERADRRAYEAKRQGRGLVVEDDPASGWSLVFESQSRLLEREFALDTVQQFLAELLQQKRGLLIVNGARGVGNTRFAAEAAKAARLRGYLVLSIRGGRAIKTRLYGALLEAEIQSERLPALTSGDRGFAQSLQQLVDGNGNSGLLIVADNLHELDAGTWRVLLFILTSPFISVAGMVSTTQDEARYRLPDLPLLTKIDLPPLSLSGVFLLLRSLLRWEPPEAFAAWLYARTNGLPAMLQRSLNYLIDQKILTPTSEGWALKPDYASTSLNPLEEAAVPLNNLPLLTTEFVGRAEELRVIKRELGQHHLITVIAPGGMGKTRLAQQAAAELIEQFPAGVFFMPLAAVGTADLILPTIMQAMGLTIAGRQDPKEVLLSYLRELRYDVLLILDNFEHLLDGSGLVAELRKSSPHVRLLMTSRERISLPDVVHYELYGLPYPALGDLSDGFEQYGSVQLFQQAVRRTMSASRGEPVVIFSEQDRRFVQRICAVVDGLPLGLELAAAWVSLFSYQEIAEQLEHNLDLLVTSRADVPVRQRSARAVFDYFWEMLSDSEQQCASSLSVFRGGFNGTAAREVAGVSPFFLSALADRTFLTRTLEGRYTLHELLRQYIAGKLDERPNDQQDVHQRHADHYFGIARAAEPELNGPRQSDWLSKLELDINNFRAAIDWYLDNDAAKSALWLISHLRLFWYVRGHHFEALDRLLSILGRADTTPPTLARAKALTTAGYLCIALSDYADGRALLEEALAIRRASGQDADIAETLSHLGMCAGLQNDNDSARRFLGEALIIWRSVDNYYEMGAVHHLLGEVCWLQDDYENARQNFIESERFLRAIGDKIVFAIPVRRLGQLALRDGDPARAYPAFIESLNHNHDLYDQRGMSACLAAFAGLALFQNRVVEAVRLLSAVDTVLNAMGASLLPVDRLEYSRMIEKARSQLDDATYNIAWAEGRAMSLDNAIDLVKQYTL